MKHKHKHWTFNVKYEHWIFKIPPMHLYDAVVVGRTMLFRQKEKEVHPILIKHELVHQRQMDKHGVLKFYLIYVKDFLIQLVKHRNWFKAYYNIPFEVEAYKQQDK